MLKTLQAWIDESEDPDHKVFMVGGFVAPAENWAKFSTEWQERLGPTRCFHMKEQHHKKPGESDGQRAERLAGWLGLIEKHVTFRAEASISLSAYRSIVKDKIGPRKDREANEVDNPYFFVFNEIVAGICRSLSSIGHTEQVDFYFDCNEICGTRADKEKYYWLARKVADSELGRCLPPRAKFEDDEKFAPLQGADMLDWVASKSLAGNLPPEFQWLRTRFMEIPALHEVTLGEEELKEGMGARIDPQLVSEWNELFG